MEPGDPETLEFPHRALGVEGIAIAGIGISDHRYRDAVEDRCKAGHHFAHAEEAHIGITHAARNCTAAGIDETETSLLDQS